MNRIVPLILAVALFMEQMDSTVIATALPAIADDLGTSPITLKLALTSYLVALAIFIPASGWVADRLGAKRVFMAAIGVFVLGSIACAVADSITWFVLARFLQGAGAAMMTPVARLTLVRATPRDKLVDAMAWLTIPALMGPITGPPIGGFLTTFFSWHWIFIINVPIGLIGIALTWRFLPEIESGPPRKFDLLGFLLLAGAAGGIVFGLSVLTMPALPVAFGAGLTALGFGCAAAYLRHVRKVAVPLIAPSLFRIPTYAAAIYAGSFFRVAVGATPFLLPLMLQLGFGMTAFESGMVTFVIAIGALSVKFGVAKLYRRIGFRVSLTAAIIVTCATIAAMGFFTPSTSLIFMFGVLILTGFTRSTFFTGVNALTYADVPPEDASQATAMSAVAQQVSLALGVAFAAGILELRILFAGTSLTLADFHMAFFIIAAVGLIAVVFTLGLPADAGASVSGHQRAGVQPSSGA